MKDAGTGMNGARTGMNSAGTPARGEAQGDPGSAAAMPEAPAGDGPRLPRALSPSRANDFKLCPLKYRLRAIDRIEEPPTPAAARGTLVHAVLERMFSMPADERTEDAVAADIPGRWSELLERSPELAGLIDDDELDDWIAAAGRLVHTYFGLEDPARFEPDACELRLEVQLPGDIPVRGVVDRVDVSPGGLVRIVDYKTGKAPPAAYAGDALFQLKFYALMWYRMRGAVPARLRLVYLGNGELVEYSPEETELLAFERSVASLWRAVQGAAERRHFPPRRNRLCDWCSFKPLCPEFGGTPPPYPGSAG